MLIQRLPGIFARRFNFPQMKKSDVNGENALPLYDYLKQQKGFECFGKGPSALALSVMLKKIDNVVTATLQ
jgi:glutathione peroxidase-family protein